MKVKELIRELLKKCAIYEGIVIANTKSCSKIHAPTKWVGERVIVVLKDGK